MSNSNSCKNSDDAIEVMAEEPNQSHSPDEAHWRRVLADAINAADPSDERLARRTWGEVSAELIAQLRQGSISPLPRWQRISTLLTICHLRAADIGQAILTEHLITQPSPRRSAGKSAGKS